MARGKRDLERERRWRELVARRSDSGLSVRAFCAQEGVPETAYHYWRRELAARDAALSGQASTAAVVRSKTTADPSPRQRSARAAARRSSSTAAQLAPSSTSGFVPVRLRERQTTTDHRSWRPVAEIIFAGTVKLRIGPELDRSALVMLLDALRSELRREEFGRERARC
jgi:transposase-like protein